MKQPTHAPHVEIFLKDYTPPDFLVDRVTLDIDIRADHAKVSASLHLRRNPASKKRKAPLVLQGETQKLLSLSLDGKAIPAAGYKLTDKDLTIPAMPDSAVLEIVSTHNPFRNTALSGLYASGPMLCTQCEAEGFRRIMFYPDRPDVMAKFFVTIHADAKTYPVLLANGNLIATGEEPAGRHFATWEDPFPKPCYLFAMVAGRLDKVADSFTTMSGRKVLLEIYTEPGKSDQTGFAMTALKKSMRWDEQTYGLEYDLDRFMIVATPFFNMGAMENKGLNIFNDACLLGRTDTATDGTISFIERVVAHEYFHNWTGDRVTCRDWFQLSLKEGLTVFREQEYMGDMDSRSVERLGNVRGLRRAQFAEDAGSMAHPIRPDRYQAIDNFYTSTVYAKGSEVVRMFQTLKGRDGFRKGMDLYFKRHDGQAVTCDDFARAMADANKLDIKQFMLWYSQAGTPSVNVTSAYNVKTKTYTLTATQKCPPTPGQRVKQPMHIPLAVGLLDDNGKDLIGTQILSLTKPKQDFVFKNIKAKPVPSLLRDFSAPVRLTYPYTDEELLFLLAHDSDSFNRWEASVKLLTKYLLALAGGKGVKEADLDRLTAALGEVLRDGALDASFKAMTLSLPSEGELGLALAAAGKPIDPGALYIARKGLVQFIAEALQPEFERMHKQLRETDPLATDGTTMGLRSLKNLCLGYLAVNEEATILARALKQTASKNMTEQVAAIAILCDTQSPQREQALRTFERRWQKNANIMDKWLALQAASRRPGVLRDVKRLMKHPAFDLKNPNRFSALIGSFAGNIRGFHNPDGSGYKFIADMILKIDPLNPHSAAGLAKAFARWRDYEPKRRRLMLAQLKRLKAAKNLSANTAEIVGKSVGQIAQTKTRRAVS